MKLVLKVRSFMAFLKITRKVSKMLNANYGFMKNSVVNNIAKFCCLSLVCLFINIDSASAGADSKSGDKSHYLRPDTVLAPSYNKLNSDRIELGKLLFFDPRLSGSNWISCATCHNPALGWSDGLPTAIGNNMKVLGRATPTIINSAYNDTQFWDGRANTLEEQAVGPIQAKGEMNQDMAKLIKELKVISGYVKKFKKAYPKEGITEVTIGKAIASFERTVVSSESPFDRWIKGDKKAISKSAKKGFKLFEGRGMCILCHHGFNFTDDGFHNIGTPFDGKEDLGRYNIKKVEVLKGAFKTPTLRDIALTAPYMHNGKLATLEDVLNHYGNVGKLKGNLSPSLTDVALSKRDKANIVEFLKTLTGDPVNIVIPQLPN